MEHSPNEFKTLFPQKDTKIILQAIINAGETLQKKSSTEKENPITTRLHKKLIRDYPFRDGPLNIQLQPQIPSTEPGEDSIDGQIDLLVPSNLGYETYFAIEAKRLRYFSPNGKLVAGSSAYVNEGMMRFVNEQYAPFMESGAMLGYIFDGDIKATHKGIDDYIRSKANELKLKSPKKLKASSILPENCIDETNHDLEKGPFKIYHILLPV